MFPISLTVKTGLIILHANILPYCLASSDDGCYNCSDNSSGIDMIEIKMGDKSMLGNLYITSQFRCVQFLLIP
jgi:hypothetical protein